MEKPADQDHELETETKTEPRNPNPPPRHEPEPDQINPNPPPRYEPETDQGNPNPRPAANSPPSHEPVSEQINPNLRPKTNTLPSLEPERNQRNPTPPPKTYSPPSQEPETEHINRIPRQKTHSPPSHEPERDQRNPSPRPKTNSPPSEPELELHTIPDTLPKTNSPPSASHQSSKSQTSSLDSLSEEEEEQKQPQLKPPTTAAPDAVVAVNTKVEPPSLEVDEERGHGHTGRKYLRPNLSILKRAKRESRVKRALLGFRICCAVFSLVSFSVLAADRDRGWALDSFYRYKEFRYGMVVNVIAFVYSGSQAYRLAYHMTIGKLKARHYLGYYYYLEFSVDQILSYLLISASSSASVRIDDWQSNWGKDEFPEMAKASVALSFLAFVALALSSLISGYTLCTLKSM